MRENIYEDEVRFLLYPTADVEQEATRLRRNQFPGSPSNLIHELEIIAGEICGTHPKNESEGEFESGQVLVVEFEDDIGGVSELHVTYGGKRQWSMFGRRGQYDSWEHPVLHPSDALASAEQYDWGAPQSIHCVEFI